MDPTDDRLSKGLFGCLSSGARPSIPGVSEETRATEGLGRSVLFTWEKRFRLLMLVFELFTDSWLTLLSISIIETASWSSSASLSGPVSCFKSSSMNESNLSNDLMISLSLIKSLT